MKLFKYIFFMMVASVFGLTSCEQTSVAAYDGKPYIAFYDSSRQYRLCVQTYQNNFYYMPSSVSRDTVWVKLQALGSMPPTDCHIRLRAYHNTTVTTLQKLDDAKSGVHFVPFDDPEMQKLLVFHANRLTDSVPVILLRDASLKKVGHRLTLRIESTDEATAADLRPDSSVDHATVVIYTADCLTQPTKWDLYFFLGAYGQVKHDFIIRHSGEKWDDDFISSLSESEKVYYLYKFRNELTTENEERKKNGQPPLTEEDGTSVSFPDK